MNVLRQLMCVGRPVVGLGVHITFPVKDHFCIAVSISDSVCAAGDQAIGDADASVAMMFAANGHQTVLLLMLLALPTTATAQAPTLFSQVPGPGETSSITTIEGGEKTTTSCWTHTQRNTLASIAQTGSHPLPSPRQCRPQ